MAYLLGIEIPRFAFLIGVAVSLVMYERRHLTTGSLIVPGYLAVYALQPLVIAATIGNAIAARWLVDDLLARRVVLYGRDRLVALSITTITIQAILLAVTPTGPYLWEPSMPFLIGVGYVIPAVIAHDMGRQGTRRTLKVVLASGLVVAAPVLLVAYVFPDLHDLAPAAGDVATAIPPAWIPLAVLLGAIASWGLHHNFGWRAGGFVGAAYVAVLSTTVAQLLFIAGVALAGWFLVTKVLMTHSIVFGRRKFGTSLLVSGILAWAILALVAPPGARPPDALPMAAIALSPLFVPGLIANDMERGGALPTLAGTALAAFFVYATIAALRSIEGGLSAPWLAAAIGSSFVVFHGQLRSLAADLRTWVRPRRLRLA
ncbi:MAG TPA: hypothetical protein ENK55_04140 [Actinobacteria bacterium]|nr:hypothetical protein [Actinomycetota bacterium]